MIKNFDDHFRMQRLGKIRLGIKKTSKKGNQYPAAVDYFVCPDEVRAVYGDKPRRLEIMVPNDDIEAVFPTALKQYGSQSGLICHGDGQTAQRRIEGSNDWREINCSYKDCEYYQQDKCKEVGNLQVILPRIKGMLGIYQLDTSSYNSILNIKSGLKMLKQTVGRCSLIPLTLEVKMQEANPLTADGKRLKTLVPVMHLKLDHTFYDVIEMARERKLIKQVQVSSPDVIELDNPEIDEKPDLLYPDDEDEPDGKIISEDDENTNEDPVSDPIDKELNVAWDILGTPEGKRKAILGKPDLDKKQLLLKLNAEIDRRAQPEENTFQEKNYDNNNPTLFF